MTRRPSFYPILQGILLTAFCFQALFSHAQAAKVADAPCWPFDIPIDSLIATGLPLVSITTVDEEEPTCDYVSAPEGSLGMSITNATKVPGRVMVILRGDTVFDSGEYEKDVSGMTIKIRGNSSAYSEKQPFKIKLQQKGDMLRRSNPRYEDKNWVLIYEASYTLNNLLARLVCKMTRMEWVPEGEYVNVIFNGHFRGLYFLSESVDRNPKCRIDVDKQTGYIIELDPYWWNEDVSFETQLTQGSPYTRYTFKYPDEDNVTEEQIAYISEEMTATERSIMDSTYADHIDVESFVTWILTHEILGTWDAQGSNTFLSKYDNTTESKMKLGPPWDFDTILQTEGEWSNMHDSMLLPWFWGDPNGQFTKRFYERLEEARVWLFDAVVRWADSFLKTDVAAGIDKSRKWDSPRWDIPFVTVASNVMTISNWFEARKQWAGQIVGINELQADPSHGARAFDLSGRRITTSPKGIYISEGRKYAR